MGSGVRRVKRECVPGGNTQIGMEAQDDVPNCFSSPSARIGRYAIRCVSRQPGRTSGYATRLGSLIARAR